MGRVGCTNVLSRSLVPGPHVVYCLLVIVIFVCVFTALHWANDAPAAGNRTEHDYYLDLHLLTAAGRFRLYSILVPATIELPLTGLGSGGGGGGGGGEMPSTRANNVVITAEQTANHHSDLNDDDLNLIDDVDPSQVYQLKEGGDLDLTCRVKGQPLPIVTWKFQVFHSFIPSTNQPGRHNIELN